MNINYIQMNLDYRGALVDIKTFAEQHCVGDVYPVKLNDAYAFTIYNNDDQEWGILKEDDGNVPEVDGELYKLVLKQLKWELVNNA